MTSTTQTTSAATVAMLATAFRPSHKLSPFPVNAPESDADWRLYHISDWAGLIEQIGWAWNDVEIVEVDNMSSNYDDHSYLIRIPYEGGADWAVCWREAEHGGAFAPSHPRITVTWETDDESPNGVIGDPGSVAMAIDYAEAWDRYHADIDGNRRCVAAEYAAAIPGA